MPRSSILFAELPIEILEEIFLRLPGQDIVKMEAISRQFQDLARGSPVLQHRRELFAAGLIDNPHSPCDLDERRRLCREYVRKWSDPANIAMHFREVPLGGGSPGWGPEPQGRNLFATYSHQSNGINFLHVPPAMTQKPIERWSIPEIPFEFSHCTTYPPENILVVVEMTEEFIHIHLLNLLDGSPYRVPPSSVITWAIQPGLRGSTIETLAMTGSRLMVCVSHRDEHWQPGHASVWKMAVWDWETGDLMFHRSIGNGGRLIRSEHQIAFLDEFRIMVPYYDDSPDGPELLVLNTLVPQDHPRNLRRFGLPPWYQGCAVRISLDHGRSLGTVNRDGPLIIDPTQAVLVVDLSSRPREQRDFLMLRTRALIEYTCSTRTDVRIPWDEWGRGVVVMNVPVYGICLTATHGARVLVIYDGHSGPQDCSDIRVFDFNRRGSTALPLSGGSSGGPERRAKFEDGRNCMFARFGEISMRDPRSLGDSVASWVIPPPGWSSSALRFFDLI